MNYNIFSTHRQNSCELYHGWDTKEAPLWLQNVSLPTIPTAAPGTQYQTSYSY